MDLALRDSSQYIKVFILLLIGGFGLLGNSPDASLSSNLYKNYYLRELIEKELVFTAELETENPEEGGAGSAFICTINGGDYLVTNDHVIQEAIINRGNDSKAALTFTNGYGRQLIITSPIYLKLDGPEKRLRLEGGKPVVPNSELSYEPFDCGDLVLIPFSRDHLSLRPLRVAAQHPKLGETIYIYGNTRGQGFINEKEGIVNRIYDEAYIGLLSDAKKGNSGGPVLDANNNLLGVLSRGIPDTKYNEFIRLDKEQIDKWTRAGKFKRYSIPSTTLTNYTQDLLAYYKPGKHISRTSGTTQPHLSIGSALGKKVDDKDFFTIRDNSRNPIKCYNWDLIDEYRLLRLCHTYGQTVYEFIPEGWIGYKFSEFILSAWRERDKKMKEFKNFSSKLNLFKQKEGREAKVDLAKELNIMSPIRAYFNHKSLGKHKMDSNGNIVPVKDLLASNNVGF